MEELLHRLDEQDRERDHEPDIERREKPAAREQEPLETAFDHDARPPPRFMPTRRAGCKRQRLGRDARPDLAGDAGAAEPAIAARVLGEVLLVVVLGEVERAGLGDLGRDRRRSRAPASARP